MASTTESGAHGIDLVHGYLEEQHAAHEVVDHEQTESAAQEGEGRGRAAQSCREDDRVA